MTSPRKGLPNKITLLAHADMERLGINPIEMLKEVYDLSIAAYKTGRGYSDKYDAGTAYLSNAVNAAAQLAKYKHPTMSAIAIKDVSEGPGGKTPMTTAEAVKILKSDPFAPAELKSIPDERIIDAMKSGIQAPMLPIGGKDGE